jgi:pyruvate/2-oxoglutarate dehydrogenase complex dihydrolipoamide acyltransferase (E2) component
VVWVVTQVLATFLGETHRLSAQEEPLGLRLELDGSNILMPTMFDPSELRSDVNGKVVRFLHEDGAEVEAGVPYIEVEAMKMVMPLLTTESGAISHTVSPGSIIEAGELLASLVRGTRLRASCAHHAATLRVQTLAEVVVFLTSRCPRCPRPDAARPQPRQEDPAVHGRVDSGG